MTPHEQKVLDKLVARKGKGISFSDFATGFRLGARIFDLRKAGYRIATRQEPLKDGGYKARYTLIRQPA